MSTHGTPSWSNPVLQANSAPAPVAPQHSELQRMVFELRNLLENSGDRQAALDVVDSIEELMSVPDPQEARPSQRAESNTCIEVNTLINKALRAVSPDVEAAGVCLLRRGIRKAEVVAQPAFAVTLIEDVLRLAIDACSKLPRLRVIRICVRKGSRNVCQLIVDYSSIDPPGEPLFKLLARYPQVVSEGVDGRLIVRFLSGLNPR